MGLHMFRINEVIRPGLMLIALLATSGCGGRLENIGRAPEITAPNTTQEHAAMMSPGDGLPVVESTRGAVPERVLPASLWNGGPGSLLGDRRAMDRGDILTVVIEIDDSAEISNSSQRARSGSEDLSIPNLLGIPQRIQGRLPEGATLDPAVGVSSSSSSSGNGSVRRNERLELRVAATIVEVLPNGVVAIQGTQEVRVNFELRELTVTGFVRPEDISRLNEITYDKIASARISYGGRGQISDVQQPRYGQQIADAVLPF